MSSSRRSPAVAITPIRDDLAELRGVVQSVAGLVHEVAEHPHRRGVVAVVDDDRTAVDLDLVQPAGGQVVVGRERPQTLPDVVQRRAGGERRRGRGHRVLHVHHRPAAEGGGQQVGPGQLHRPPAVLDHDHVAELAALQDHRPATAPAVVVDRLAHLAARLGHGEPDDLAGTAPAHLAHQRVVGVQHGVPVARHRLDQHRLHVGQLLEGVDAAQTEVIGLDVQHHGDVVALVAQTLAQDAAAGDLEHGEVDPRVLQHHPGGLRSGRVGADDQPLVDHHAVGRGHPDLAADALEDVGDHPRGRGLAVRAGDRDDRDPAGRARREQHVDHRLGDVLRVADRRVGVHPEAGRGVHLADRAAGLAHRLGDVGADEVDAGDVEPDHPGRLLGDLDVLRVRLEGPVDRDAAGGHVAGQRELDHVAGGRHVVHLETLLRHELDGRVVDRDPGQHLLVPDAAARVGVGDVDQLGDGVRAVADDVGGHPLGDRRHPAVDDQAAVVLAGDEVLDDHPAVRDSLLRDRERRPGPRPRRVRFKQTPRPWLPSSGLHTTG